MISYSHTYQACASILLGFLLGFHQLDAQSSYTLETIHTFHGGPSDGSLPGGLVAASGVLYGTTALGGAFGMGAIYSLTPSPTSPEKWTEALIYSFAGGGTGKRPNRALAVDRKGVLYGIAETGSGSGPIAYSLAPPTGGAATWTYSVLCVFAGGAQGLFPNPQLTVGGGVLYGLMTGGGAFGQGVVFSLTPPSTPSDPWSETVLHSFQGGTDGSVPNSSSVVIGKGGVLYGTTYEGGVPGSFGTVFSLAPPSAPGGQWTESILYSFTGGADGALPSAGLAIGSGGELYGTAPFGGISSCGYQCGTAFALTPPAAPGEPWAFSTIYSFTGGDGGQNPIAGVVVGPGGVLFGDAGGPQGSDVVYSLTPPAQPGGPWTYALVHEVAGSGLDSGPINDVIVSKEGVVYGTTPWERGTAHLGTVYRLVP